MLNPWTNQIILGTLLGSGYIRKHGKSHYLGFSESHDRNWYDYKAIELGTLAAATPKILCRGILKWRSRSAAHWSSYYDLFYGEGRTMPMSVLDQLRDIGLATWFGDKGFWYSTHRVGLRASKFLSRENGVNYFNEVGIPCREKRKGIIFTPKGTERFLGTIAHRLPEFLHYRLKSR